MLTVKREGFNVPIFIEKIHLVTLLEDYFGMCFLLVFFFKGAFAIAFLFKEDWFIAEWCLFFPDPSLEED